MNRYTKVLFASLFAFIVASCGALNQDASKDSEVKTQNVEEVEQPELHVIKKVELKMPYSCEGSYEDSALFLTEHTRQYNGPDLLYNGACGTENYIEASTAGDDFTLIANLGDVPIEEVTASKAFNYTRTASQSNIFKTDQEVVVGDTYVVLSSKSDLRSLVVYKVLEHKPDGKLVLEYAVKSYSLHDRIRNKGFSWKEKSRRP